MSSWKDIPEFEYEINEIGDIRSKKFKRMLTPSIDKDGYKQIGIRKVGVRKKYWFRIHRLVAVLFCKELKSDTKNEIDHIDRDVTNNHYTNLRWVDKLENNANRKNSAWATNTTTGELYITKYRNGYMIRINRNDLKHKSWHKTIEEAIIVRNSVVAGAVVSSETKFSQSIA
jgi:hypothetical protein